jgi:hypothetical protein
MSGTGYSFENAAKKAGVPVSAVFAAVRHGDVKAFVLNGVKVVNEVGIDFLRGVAQARAELAVAGEAPAARVPAAVVEDPASPSSWTEEEIEARGHALGASLLKEGTGVSAQAGPALAASNVRIKEGR